MTKICCSLMWLILLFTAREAFSSENEVVVAAAKRAAPTVNWDSASLVKADVNGDGSTDYALVGLSGKRIFVGVVLGPASEKARVEVLSFGIGTHSQDSICELPAKIEVEPLECMPLEDKLPGCRPLAKANSLVLYGGECDPINFYWDHEKNILQWWRM